MKIFEIQLKDPSGQVLYKTLVPEIHVMEKIMTLVSMNEIHKIGAITFAHQGDISDRYIQTFIHREKKKEQEK